MADMFQEAGRPSRGGNRGRRRMRKSGCIAGVIVLIAFMIAIAGTIYYMSAYESITLDESVTVSVPEGTAAKSIAGILKDADLIKSEFIFNFYVKQQGAENSLRPGEYTFGPGEVDMASILDDLKRGGQQGNTMNITIPEGLTVEQTADHLAKDGIVDKQAFLDYAGSLDIPYDYIPQGTDFNQLEGFLFPETYNIMTSWGEKEIIDMMLAQFDKVFNEEYRARAAELDMSIYEVVTLASIVEREALYDSDRPIIAGVFYNRLDQGMRLESCATVQYVLGEQKPVLTYADTSIQDPYNTYQNAGLTPGPIASPGKSSLEATLYPEDTDYLFFLAMPDGHHFFSRTYDEHNAGKEKYLS